MWKFYYQYFLIQLYFDFREKIPYLTQVSLSHWLQSQLLYKQDVAKFFLKMKSLQHYSTMVFKDLTRINTVKCLSKVASLNIFKEAAETPQLYSIQWLKGGPSTRTSSCQVVKASQLANKKRNSSLTLTWKKLVLAILVTGERTCCLAWITLTLKASTAFRPMSSLYTRDIRTSPLWLYINNPPNIVGMLSFCTY